VSVRSIIFASLFVAGCATTIHVDRNNSGPADGSAQRPFPTIQQGLNAVNFGEAVEVRPGTYTESVVMKRNTNLRGTPGAALIGTGNQPTITAPGNNSIRDLTILGGGSGVLLQWDGIGRPEVETQFTIERVEVRDANRGVELTTPDQYGFDQPEPVPLVLNVTGNFFRGLVNSGVTVTHRGPSTGTVILRLSIANNVVEQTFSAIQLSADERHSSEGNLPSAQILGEIRNNLLVLNRNGIQMDAASRSAVSPLIVGNTIARNTLHGITASVEGGSFGPGLGVVGVNLERNIIAANTGFGYQEFTERTSAILHDNLFFQNSDGNYADAESGDAINGQGAINDLDNSDDNRVADPLFVRGSAPILGNLNNVVPGPGEFFLQQDATAVSPAVNGGPITVEDARLAGKTTNVTLAPDSGLVDLGFHFTPF